MSKVEVKFEFDTLADSQNFYTRLYLFEVAEIHICEFQSVLYKALKEKKHKKASNEVKLLEELLDEYHNLFSDFVLPEYEEEEKENT
jgi:hypothetical protein